LIEQTRCGHVEPSPDDDAIVVGEKAMETTRRR
jgi:hypothetical protein